MVFRVDMALGYGAVAFLKLLLTLIGLLTTTSKWACGCVVVVVVAVVFCDDYFVLRKENCCACWSRG